MKNHKVLNLRTHLGGLHGKTSFDAVKDKVDMELWPVGVYIKSIDSKPVEMLIPFPNIVEARLAPIGPGDEDLVCPTPPRGPGRPAIVKPTPAA